MTKHSIRTCLHVDYWPALDQLQWHKVTTPRTVLDEEGGRSAGWRARTREKNRKGYGRWLSFLILNSELRANVAPTERITRERVKTYVLMLQDQVASWTVWSYVTCLHQVAMAFAPNGDWAWLYNISAKLRVRRSASRNKRARMRSADDIAAWAYKRMDILNDDGDRRPATVLEYRDALFIAVLINCPMRLRNLVMIRIGHHLQWTGDSYRLDYTPSEVKTNRYLTLHCPSILTTYIDDWINDWRPHLLRDVTIDALWIGIRGAPMYERGIYQRICCTTQEAFGVSINPHLFRDIAVTTIADQIPENIGITAPILGHINPKTTEDHYIHANQVMATWRFRQSVNELRKQGKAFADRNRQISLHQQGER